MLHRFSPDSGFEALSWWAPKPYCAAHGPGPHTRGPPTTALRVLSRAPSVLVGVLLPLAVRRCVAARIRLHFFWEYSPSFSSSPIFSSLGRRWVECVQIPTASLSVSCFENRDSRNSGRRRSLLRARPTYASWMNLRSRASALRCAFCSFVNFSMVAYAASSVPSAWRRA